MASGMDLFSQAGICVCMQGFVAGQGFVAADRDLWRPGRGLWWHAGIVASGRSFVVAGRDLWRPACVCGRECMLGWRVCGNPQESMAAGDEFAAAGQGFVVASRDLLRLALCEACICVSRAWIRAGRQEFCGGKQ